VDFPARTKSSILLARQPKLRFGSASESSPFIFLSCAVDIANRVRSVSEPNFLDQCSIFIFQVSLALLNWFLVQYIVGFIRFIYEVNEGIYEFFSNRQTLYLFNFIFYLPILGLLVSNRYY